MRTNLHCNTVRTDLRNLNFSAKPEEMVGRRGGLSGKQKATLLKSKAAQKRASGTTAHSTDGTASGGGRAAAPAPHVVQQMSRMGHVNQLSTAFLREEDGAVAARRLAASLPLRTEMRGQPLVASPTTDEGSFVPPPPISPICRTPLSPIPQNVILFFRVSRNAAPAAVAWAPERRRCAGGGGAGAL